MNTQHGPHVTKVRCVDNSNPAEHYIHKGGIYVIKAYQSGNPPFSKDSYYIDDDQGSRWWMCTRFEVVETNETIVSVSPTSITVTPTDPEEDRLWSLMRPRLDPNQCVCGIDKDRCDYHRTLHPLAHR